MKIGILTLPLHTNYGGILQAYALQTVLERMGHEVVVYNRDRRPRKESFAQTAYQFVYRCLYTLRSRSLQPYYNINKESKVRYNNFLIKTKYTQQCVDRYIHSHYVNNYITDIITSGVDCVVVGSDQIWDYYNGGSISGSVANAYLLFLPDGIKRFSYAASFGKDAWNYSTKQTQIASEGIKKFSGVSVRESTGVDLCRAHLHAEAQVNIDPTMLLKAEDYVQAMGIESVPVSNGNLLVYVLDRTPQKDSIVEYVEKNLGLKHFRVNSLAEDTNNTSASIEDKIQPPVEKWLRGFMDAKFVVTDSFHACVFSILFHKPFIVIGNKERGLTRFISLLIKFNLEDRLVDSLDDVKYRHLTDLVDFDNAERVLQVEREHSASYLKNNLEQ